MRSSCIALPHPEAKDKKQRESRDTITSTFRTHHVRDLESRDICHTDLQGTADSGRAAVKRARARATADKAAEVCGSLGGHRQRQRHLRHVDARECGRERGLTARQAPEGRSGCSVWLASACARRQASGARRGYAHCLRSWAGSRRHCCPGGYANSKSGTWRSSSPAGAETDECTLSGARLRAIAVASRVGCT